jgi:hypothetical protein
LRLSGVDEQEILNIKYRIKDSMITPATIDEVGKQLKIKFIINSGKEDSAHVLANGDKTSEKVIRLALIQ